MSLHSCRPHVLALVFLLVTWWAPAPVLTTAQAASAAGQSQDAATHPYVMQQAANEVATAKLGPLQPFQPGTRPALAVGGAGNLTREVFGFAYASSLSDPTVGYPSWNFDDLSTVAIFGLHVNPDGSFSNDSGLTVWNSSQVGSLVTTAHAHATKVVVTIILQDFSSGTPAMCAGLSSTSAAATVRNTVAEVRAKGVDGVNVDYEGLNGSCGASDPSWARHNFTAFVQGLRAGLGSAPYLSVDTYGSSAGDPAGFFDVPGIAASADSLFVMAYDMEYSNQNYAPMSCPGIARLRCLGPTAPLTGYRYNDTNILGQYVGSIPRSKVILGVPYYGRKACVGSAAANQAPVGAVLADGYQDAIGEAPLAQPGSYVAHRDAFDPTGSERWDTWQNGSCTRELYWDDTASLGQKYALVNQDGLRGVGIWTLSYGGSAPELWANLASHFGSAAPSTNTAATGWTTYHHDNSRNGLDPGAQAFPPNGPASQHWSTSLDGAVYAEPLALSGRVYAATENNSIYALDEITGTALWRWHQLAPQPDPASAVGCGNINPVGITGTPVIDPAAQVIYAVGLVAASGGGTKYQLFAVSLGTGTLLSGYPRDIGQPNPIYQIQRAALGLAPNGLTVYVAFGGWSGDCTPYHPIVVGVPVGANLGQGQLLYEPQNTSTQNGGGIWEASGMSIDASGNLYVETGNGFYNTSTPCDNTKWDHGDSVLKLSPTLAELSSFAPFNWCALNLADADLGSVGPLLLQNGEVLASGKSGDGWLLNGANLGGVGIGGELYSNHIDSCPNGGAVFGGMAYAAPYVYVPCDGTGLIALNVDTVNKNFTVAWKTTAFTPTAPIVAGGVVWTMSANALLGYDAVTGAPRFNAPILAHTRFATPTEDNGWLLVPQQTSVAGFSFGTSWQSLGGSLSSGAGPASCAAGSLDAFVLGGDGVPWRKTWNGTSWGPWILVGGHVMSDPSAVCRPTTTNIDLFTEGVDRALYHRTWNGSSWQPWESLGGSLTSGPGAASCAAGQLDVFVLGGDGVPWRKTWNGTTWGPWTLVGGHVTGDPAAVCEPGTNKIDLFIRGVDDALWHRLWDGTSWQPWESLGGSLTSGPAASSCAAGKVDTFVLGGDGVLWRKSFDGTSWGIWTRIGGGWTSDPGAVCQPGTTKIDLFERGTDNGLWTLELPS